MPGLPGVVVPAVPPVGGLVPVISFFIAFLMPKGKVERNSAVNIDLEGNLLEQRRVGAHSGCVASGEHVEANPFGREVARQACRAQHANASYRREYISN